MENPLQSIDALSAYWSQPPPYKVVATDKSCLGCNKEIQPGQSYAPSRRGPRHIICARDR